MKANLRFTYPRVDFSKKNQNHLVLSLTAPVAEDEAKRPTICILPVVDVSGSMRGPKLDYAQKSLLKLVDHLRPGDYCGLVTFSSSVSVVSKPALMTSENKEALKARIGELVAVGGTNFSGGMLEGLRLLRDTDFHRETLTRLVMFTDGQANEGIAQKREQLQPLLEQQRGRVTVSAFSYGADADQDLLEALAQTGKGNYAFIQNPDDALAAFAKELGGLLSTYAQNLAIRVKPHAPHEIVDVVSDVDSSETEGVVTIKVPDILAEETRNLVLEVALAEQPKAFPRATSVFDVEVTYDRMDATGALKTEKVELKAKLEFVKPGEEDSKPDAEAMSLVAAALLVQRQVEAETQAQKGNFAGAALILENVSKQFANAGMGAYAAVAQDLGSKMSNHVMYSANTGYLKSMKGGFTRSVGVSSYDASAMQALSSVGINATSNAVQAQTVSSFQNSADVPATAAVPVDLSALSNGVLTHTAGVGAGVTGAAIRIPAVAQVAPVIPSKAKTKTASKSSKGW